MNDNKRREIFESNERWVEVFDNNKIRIDRWDEDSNIYRIGTVSNLCGEHWHYTYHRYDPKWMVMFGTGHTDKDLLRRLIP